MKKRKLKIKPLIFVFALILVVSVGVTTAYYYTQNSIRNDFNLSDYSMSIKTEFKDTCVFNDTSADEPNKITNLSITNDGDEAVLLRFYYIEKFYDSTDGTQSNLVYNGSELVTKNWNTAFGDFIYKDGWYYYTKVLDKDETVNILDSVTYNLEESFDFIATLYDIDFKYEVLQVKHNPSQEVWGYKANISGDNVTWNFN